MTKIRLGIIADEPDGTPAQVSGAIEWKPSRRRDVGDDVAIPKPFEIALSPDKPAPVIDISATSPDWAWVVIERTPGGIKRHLAVPQSHLVIDYQDLVEVDPETLIPEAEPEAAWWVALNNFQPPAAADPEVIGEAITDYMTEHGDDILSVHINHPEPHPVYDEIPSLRLLFENGLV